MKPWIILLAISLLGTLQESSSFSSAFSVFATSRRLGCNNIHSSAKVRDRDDDLSLNRLRIRRSSARVDDIETETKTSIPWFLDEAGTGMPRSDADLPKPSSFFLANSVPGPSLDSKPDYESIYGPLGPLADQVFQSVFRSKLAEHAGFDSDLPGYAGIIDIAVEMNKRYSREQVQKRARQVLVSLFPSWMPPSYAVLFSKPYPGFSSRMNAWATWVAGTWLMGECELNDVVLTPENGNDDGIESERIGKNQGLLVKRCRFLEEAGCASVCVNSCKIPTQTFFLENMGLPLTMEPNYDTFECQFSFGKLPTTETELAAKSTPCLARCPTAGRLRQWHTSVASSQGDSNNVCELMGT